MNSKNQTCRIAARLRIVAWASTLLTVLPPVASGGEGTDRVLGIDSPALSALIDELVSAHWSDKQKPPAPLSDDAEFLRRVSLDLSGRIPRIAEVRDFLDDTTVDKRRRLVDERLRDPDFVNHFARVWRTWFIGPTTGQRARFLAPRLEEWLRRQFQAEVPYDKVVKAILTAPLTHEPGSSTEPGALTRPSSGASAFVFYQANELKPELLAASASRLFLGVNLECAQCHNHPFAPWTHDQFWQFAAFFAGVRAVRPGCAAVAAPEDLTLRELTVPGTDRLVSATFLDGATPVLSSERSPRFALAQWMTSPENPYFARALANRLWVYFFGKGLCEPLDQLGGKDPPSHPELLDELARQLVAHDFDWTFLVRAIMNSKAYQRSSAAVDGLPDDRPFARMAMRAMSPEQFFDSLSLATGYDPSSNSVAEPGSESPQAEFHTKFASLDLPTEVQTTIVQALTLMHGRFIAGATSLRYGGMLAAVADAPFLDTAGRIESLYLATVSRRPTADECDQALALFKSSDSVAEGEQLGDLFWVLLNSSEFLFNH